MPAINLHLNSHLENEKEFNEACALLGRLMARRKNSFHGMIGFQTIKKLNSAVCRLLRVDFKRDLERFMSFLPDFCYGTAEVPNKNCLDYLMMRLVSVHALHGRIQEQSQQAVDHFAKLMRNNFFLEITTLFVAVFSKLHHLSIILGNKCCDLYKKMLKVRNEFPKGKTEFLPPDYQIPEELKKFEIKENAVNSTAMFSKEKNIQFSKKSAKPSIKLMSTVPPKIKQKDLGTEIERNTSAAVKSFDINALTTVDQITKFIKQENKARQQTPKNCRTNKLQYHEWLGAQKLFERKVQAGESEKAIKIFTKFLASKIK